MKELNDEDPNHHSYYLLHLQEVECPSLVENEVENSQQEEPILIEPVVDLIHESLRSGCLT